jgi:UDP-galactopyranose mutase
MYLIVGCGLSGAVIAERISNILNEKVIIIDKLPHIGGNCYDYIDEDTGILCNKYGAHIFHTNNEEVWSYINSFQTKWIRWEHKVLSKVDNRYVSVPINITTINELCNETITNSNEMDIWLKNNQITFDKINNSEEIALSRIGTTLYDKLIKNYTYKQWNKYPNELDKSVLERIPVRNNFDTRYFNDKYQVLPEKGYTEFIKELLHNPLITIYLNTDFNDFKQNNDLSIYKKIIFTGKIDTFYHDKGMEKLEYRSINFIKEVYQNTHFFQQNSVINYPSPDVPFTRIVEYKHFLNQESPHTIIFKEITTDYGHPFYPVPNHRNIILYEKYKSLADKEDNIIFVGRLANYKYFNMDEAIANALSSFYKYMYKQL